MKLRIKDNSIRLRVSQSDLAALLRDGRIVERIRFGPASDARLGYALEIRDTHQEITIDYRDGTAIVALSSAAARHWAASDDVGIYGDAETGDGPVALLVEKDFACLDRNDPQDEDAFPHPGEGMVC